MALGSTHFGVDGRLAAVAFVVLLTLWPAHNALLAAFALWRPRPDRNVGTESGDLQFWIMIPALNEERVVHQTVQAALALDQAGLPVNVLVIDDGSTDATPEILAGITDPRLHVLTRRSPDAQRGKGEALNAGYRFIRERVGDDTARTVVGVIDGDGRGSPDMLREVAAFFRSPTVGAVQCRVRIHNRAKLLGFLQDIEFSCVADASQSLRDVLGCVDLGGNGQFVRLSELTRFGDAPWSACLVEDLELGLRLHIEGVRIRYATDAVITQQAVVDASRLVRQRTRWGQGNLQCLRYLPKLVVARRVRAVAVLDFAYYLLAPWLMVPMSLVVVGLLGLMAYAEATGDGLGGIVAVGPDLPFSLGVWVAALFGPGLLWGVVHRVRLRDEPLRRTLFIGLLYPGFLLLGTVAAWRAMGRHLAGRNAWAKTERLVEEIVEEIAAVGVAVVDAAAAGVAVGVAAVGSALTEAAEAAETALRESLKESREAKEAKEPEPSESAEPGPSESPTIAPQPRRPAAVGVRETSARPRILRLVPPAERVDPAA